MKIIYLSFFLSVVNLNSCCMFALPKPALFESFFDSFLKMRKTSFELLSRGLDFFSGKRRKTKHRISGWSCSNFWMYLMHGRWNKPWLSVNMETLSFAFCTVLFNKYFNQLWEKGFCKLQYNSVLQSNCNSTLESNTIFKINFPDFYKVQKSPSDL